MALSGRPADDVLLHRAAELLDGAGPGATFTAVHVARSAGRTETGAGVAAMAGQRALAEALGASYHVVVGTDVAHGLLDFADAVGPLQLVLGRSALRLRRSTSAAVVRRRGWTSTWSAPTAAVGAPAFCPSCAAG